MQLQDRWKAVGISMAAGAAYDLAFAAAILAFPVPAAALLGLELPADPVYLRLNGIFLLLLAGLYGLPAFAPRRYSGVVAVASAGRALGFMFFLVTWIGGAPPVFLALGLVDLAFAFVHGALLWRAGGLSSQPEQNKGS